LQPLWKLVESRQRADTLRSAFEAYAKDRSNPTNPTISPVYSFQAETGPVYRSMPIHAIEVETQAGGTIMQGVKRYVPGRGKVWSFMRTI
jgi:hypothetical protein